MTSPTGIRLVPLYEGIAQPEWPAKDPSETVSYAADFSRILSPSAVIVQLDVTTDLAVRASSWTGTVVALLLAGGTPSTTPTIGITLTLRDGQQIARAVALPIVSQFVSPLVHPDALTINGLPLTADADALILSGPDQPVTLDQAPLIAGTTPILLGT